MQVDLKRGEGASGPRGAGRLAAILTGAPLVAMLTLFAPDQTLAACGASHPAGVHASASGGGSVHAATGIAASSGGGGVGGGGSLGCASGSSASGLRGLPVAASGRVVEGGAHHAVGRTAVHARTAATRNAATTGPSHAAATRTTNASAHARAARPGHRA